MNLRSKKHYDGEELSSDHNALYLTFSRLCSRSAELMQVSLCSHLLADFFGFLFQ